MYDKTYGKPSFVEEMNAALIQYQLEKIRKQDSNPHCGQRYQRERQAKQTLIDLDNDVDASQVTEEDIFIGRWSQYRVPEKIDDRLSINKRSKKFEGDERQFYRYHPHRQKTGIQYNCQSERTIPKLKVILHQLEQPLHIPPRPKSKIIIPNQASKKMKTHIGRQALAISNKQQIKSSAKSQRKPTSVLDVAGNGIENKRPASNNDNLYIRTAAACYQKIKRPFGLHNQQEKDPQYEKQLLSQLIKGRCTVAPEATTLTSMLDYFTQTTDKKRRTTSKLGLDRLLS